MKTLKKSPRLVKFNTLVNKIYAEGGPIYINPMQVVSVTPHTKFSAGQYGSEFYWASDDWALIVLPGERVIVDMSFNKVIKLLKGK